MIYLSTSESRVSFLNVDEEVSTISLPHVFFLYRTFWGTLVIVPIHVLVNLNYDTFDTDLWP